MSVVLLTMSTCTHAQTDTSAYQLDSCVRRFELLTAVRQCSRENEDRNTGSAADVALASDRITFHSCATSHYVSFVTFDLHNPNIVLSGRLAPKHFHLQFAATVLFEIQQQELIRR